MNWYKIESKMRALFHQVLTPIVKRQHEDRKTMLQTERNLGFHTVRLEDLEQFMFQVKEEDAEIAAAKKKNRKAKDEDEGSEESESDDEQLVSGTDGQSVSLS